MTQLAIIVGYLVLLVGLGLASGRLLRGTSRDYLLASHSIGPVLLLLSLFGTTMTGFSLVGSTGEAYRHGIGVYGMMASSSGIVHSLCFFLIGTRVWAIGRRNGYTTQIQFFRERLESNGIGLLLFPVLGGLVIPYLLIGVLASGSVVNGVTQGEFPRLFPGYGGGVPPWLASLVICLVVLVYVFVGGMRGTAWANAFQTVVFMVLGVATFYVIATKLSGESGLLSAMQKASAAVSPDRLTRQAISPALFLSYMLVPLSIGMFPHVFQHWLTARSAASFKLPIVVHPIFIMIVWAPCVLVGVWASTELAGIPNGVPPNAELAFLVNKVAGPTLLGLLSAGILAAIMSSLDSQFLCLGTIFTNDVVLHYAGRDRFSERQIVLLARSFIVAVVAVTYGLSLFEPRRVFTLGVWVFSGFSSLVPLVLAAIYWKRLTKAGAWASVLVAAGTWLYFFHESGYGKEQVTDRFGMLPVASITLAAAVALVAVSLVTRPPSAETLARFFPDCGSDGGTASSSGTTSGKQKA